MIFLLNLYIINIMDAKEFSEKSSKIIGTTKVVLTSIKHKDNQYELQLFSNVKATVTGWVVIAKLIPKDQSIPEFTFRWDHGKGEVDVDIFLSNTSRKDLWSELGYKGHKTVFLKEKGREYEADIWIPNRHIFNGIVSVGLLQGLTLKEGISMSDSATVQVVD
jgi:hypothetical protein